MQTSASELAASITDQLPHKLAGTLQFWGVWFGGPYDNWHVVVAASASDERLDIAFDGGETLSVWQPAGWSFGTRLFTIKSASRVLWQWHWYGRPQTPENLMHYDLVRRHFTVGFESNFPHAPCPKLARRKPAVALHHAV